MFNFRPLHSRLSVDIGATEEFLGPQTTKFREGHTKVSDVEKIYLTGPYKQKYKTLSDFYNATPKRIYPVLEWNGTPSTRKIRSAYPNVRLKSAQLHSTSAHMSSVYHQQCTTPARYPAGLKEITVKSTIL